MPRPWRMHEHDGPGPHCGPDFHGMHHHDLHARMHEARMRHHRRHPPPRMQRFLFFSFGAAILLATLVSSMLFRIFVDPAAARDASGHGTPLFPLCIAATGLWLLSGFLSRRLTMPLRALGRVADELGEGRLDSRVKLPHRGTREVVELAHAFNTMAERISSQLEGQKDLLSAVSHELRTPLARLRVLVEMAREKGSDNELVLRMEQEIADMDALVGELLASARIETGALQKTRLGVADVLAPLRSDASLVGVDVRDETAGAQLDADPTLLARALRILLDNARKYGGKQVILHARAEANQVVFEVEDDGPGFPEADLPRALEPFARGRDAKEQHPGVGLGLYLVRRIAEAHGGHASARNNATRGATVGFSVRAAS